MWEVSIEATGHAEEARSVGSSDPGTAGLGAWTLEHISGWNVETHLRSTRRKRSWVAAVYPVAGTSTVMQGSE